MMHYDNVIIYSLVTDKNEIVPHGSLFDSLEYLMQIYEVNPSIKLLLFVLPYKHLSRPSEEKIRAELRDIVWNRYDVDMQFLDNIEFIDLRRVFFDYEFRKVLTLDLATPKFLKDFGIRANEVFIVPEWTTDEYFYQSNINDVTYFTEMPFCHCDVPYKMKFAFDKMRDFHNYAPYLYVNYPKYDWKFDADATKWVADHRMSPMTKGDKFYPDLHAQFHHYVYFKSPFWFDPHPRLFHECARYGKPFWYFNNNGVLDGSYYRHEDVQEEELSKRELTKDDEIVRRMST